MNRTKQMLEYISVDGGHIYPASEICFILLSEPQLSHTLKCECHLKGTHWKNLHVRFLYSIVYTADVAAIYSRGLCGRPHTTHASTTTD